ncbi:MAG: hypothetical protein ACE5G2_08535 [Candidatus Krumholzibacteriia bacterium]
MKRLGILALVLSFAIPQITAGEGALLLSGARVLDPHGRSWLECRQVLVVGSHIQRIAPAGTFRVPDDAERVDLTGLDLFPGLIDLHCHLLLHPYDEAAWDDQVLRESLELRTPRASTALARRTRSSP